MDGESRLPWSELLEAIWWTVRHSGVWKRVPGAILGGKMAPEVAQNWNFHKDIPAYRTYRVFFSTTVRHFEFTKHDVY